VLTELIAWTIPGGAPFTIDAVNKLKITASTTDVTKHSSYSLTVKDWVTYGSQNFQPSVIFTFKVTDPCRTTIITPIVLPATWTIVLGTIDFKTFTEAIDSAKTT
jgi:hypothetical protein